MENEALKNVELLLKETEQSSYFEKHSRWIDLLARTEQDQKLDVLNIFLNYFPFNYEQWLEYIELTGPEKFQEEALKRNSKSYELWINYLDYVKKSPISQDASKYKKEIEKAIVEIGADARVGDIYIEYFGLLSENYRYEYFKRIFTRGLINLEEIYALFEKWFNSKTEEELVAIAAKETKNRFVVPTNELRDFLTKEIKETYNKTLIYREKRLGLERQIKVWYFNGDEKSIESDRQIWREMIQLERSCSTVENISYCYERMLMAQMHSIEMWEEVINYLENETNKYSKVLNNFRFNRNFFLKFDIDLYFYWCDLEERESVNEARKMYLELQKCNSKPEITLRHIQFEIRQKEWDNAKNLFDTLLAQNQTLEKIDLLAYILVEYGNYINKYYKNHEYTKDLFHGFFTAYPYNHYLFTNYLNFMRNLEYKEGYYDELMTLIIEGLKKAKVAMNNEDFEKKVVKMVKHHLRTVLSSIYLIKLSERKMLDFDRN